MIIAISTNDLHTTVVAIAHTDLFFLFTIQNHYIVFCWISVAKFTILLTLLVAQIHRYIDYEEVSIAPLWLSLDIICRLFRTV